MTALILVALMTAFPSVSARAQAVPGSFNYQGRLTDLNNNPTNASVAFYFSIFDQPTGGTLLWPTSGQEPQTLNVVNGVFATQVGSVDPISASVLSSSSAYLDVAVGGTGTNHLSPRIQLVSVPYAFLAGNVSPGSSNYIQNTGSLQAGATFYVSSGTVAGNFMVGAGTLTVTQSGNVGIGTSVPTSTLTVTRPISDQGNFVPHGIVMVTGTCSIGASGTCSAGVACPVGMMTIATQCELTSGGGTLQNNYSGSCVYSCSIACAAQALATCIYLQ